jgi:ATP-dependent DNA helicase RecQ
VKVLAALEGGPLSVVELDSATGVRRGRLETLLKILAVDDVVTKDGTRWAASGKVYVHDSAKWDSLAGVRRNEADLMRQYAHGRGCLMAYLQRALDDPSPAACGRCSVCTGELPTPGTNPAPQWMEAARTFSRGIDIVVEPRKLWPKGASRPGRISGLAGGRAVAFADDPGWAEALRDLQRGGHAVVPEALVSGAVEVLKRWSKVWPKRPVAVVPAPAFGAEAAANRQVAAEIAEIGKLPLLDVFSWVGEPAPQDQSSGPTVEHLESVISLDPATALPSGPVLLCATTMRTGWAVTVAAALLTEAGAGPVMPLIVHRLP